MDFKPGELTTLKTIILRRFNMIEFQSFLLERTGIDLFDHIIMVTPWKTSIVQFLHTQARNNTLMPTLLALEAVMPEEPFLKKIIFNQGISYHLYNGKPEATLLDTDALQGMVNSETMFDTEIFFNKIGLVKRCVCKVEITNNLGQTGSGTGFLISPNQVMTNFHVVEKILGNVALLNQVKVIFDYEAQIDDNEVFAGSIYSLDPAKPIELMSKYCNFDMEGQANINLECGDDELDYAILNLSEKVGELPFGINAKNANNEETRGWIPLEIPIDNQLFEKGSVIIFQHPEGKPQKIALGLNKIMAVSPTKKRVRYNVNTMRGSSGSPVFNTNFELIALHNMGDPKFRPEFNQGVVIERIINDLVKKGYQIQL